MDLKNEFLIKAFGEAYKFIDDAAEVKRFLNQPFPELGNKTPYETAQNAQGLHAVLYLIQEIEAGRHAYLDGLIDRQINSDETLRDVFSVVMEFYGGNDKAAARRMMFDPDAFRDEGLRGRRAVDFCKNKEKAERAKQVLLASIHGVYL